MSHQRKIYGICLICDRAIYYSDGFILERTTRDEKKVIDSIRTLSEFIGNYELADAPVQQDTFMHIHCAAKYTKSALEAIKMSEDETRFTNSNQKSNPTAVLRFKNSESQEQGLKRLEEKNGWNVSSVPHHIVDGKMGKELHSGSKKDCKFCRQAEKAPKSSDSVGDKK